MHTVTLSTFPHVNTGETTWQVFVGGMPVTRETDSQAQATEWFERHCKDLSTHGRKAERKFWDGFSGVGTPL